MERWRFASPDPEATRAIGRELGRAIGADGLVIALVGPLGAGKTVFVKGLAEGLGVEPRAVSSPTFVIAQQYALPDGPETLHHVDLYRLEREEELEAIGFDEMFSPGEVLAVEWADRFPGVLGAEWLRIELGPPEAGAGAEAGAGTGREARVEAQGEDPRRVLADWADRVERGPGLPAVATPTGGSDRAGRGGPGVGLGAGEPREMRLLAGLALAGLLVLGAAGLRPGDSEGPPSRGDCERLAPRAADAFGTLRVACAETADEPVPHLVGVARLVHGARVDLTTASAELLEALPGIGPARAAAIVGHRAERPFASLASLEAVPGIGPGTRARLERWLEVGADRAESRRDHSRREGAMTREEGTR